MLLRKYPCSPLSSLSSQYLEHRPCPSLQGVLENNKHNAPLLVPRSQRLHLHLMFTQDVLGSGNFDIFIEIAPRAEERYMSEADPEEVPY